MSDTVECMDIEYICRIEQLNRMCVALITFHVCNLYRARDNAYIYIYPRRIGGVVQFGVYVSV